MAPSEPIFTRLGHRRWDMANDCCGDCGRSAYQIIHQRISCEGARRRDQQAQQAQLQQALMNSNPFTGLGPPAQVNPGKYAVPAGYLDTFPESGAPVARPRDPPDAVLLLLEP